MSAEVSLLTAEQTAVNSPHFLESELLNSSSKKTRCPECLLTASEPARKQETLFLQQKLQSALWEEVNTRNKS